MRVLFVILVFTFFIGGLCHGQPNPPDPPGGGGNPGVPITGIEILLVLGGLVGAKKVIGLKRRKN